MGDEQINASIQRIKSARRRKIVRRVLWSALAAAIIGGGTAGIVYYSKRVNTDLPGMAYPNVGREHIALNAAPPKPYNSNPPSSGAHYGTAANWGVYDYEVNDKIFMHNLEHGGVWLSYRPTLSTEVINDLKRFVEDNKNSKLVMAPRSANDADIAMAVWGRVLKLDLDGGTLKPEDLDKISEFYKRLKNRGPELVPDTSPGIDPKTVQQ
ncbi:MAG: DUF3105 domain-containing protein [Candidatus Sungbacteria bacterium]|nr:DUF3105 domain-containing protein [Candidatus Sungbacteria bacterium]